MCFGIRYLAFVSWHLPFSIHCLFCIKLTLKLTNLCRFDEWRSVGHHTVLLSSFLMASRNDGDLKDKGRTLWDALKNKISIGQTKFNNSRTATKLMVRRQISGNPDRWENFINKVPVVIFFAAAFTPHSYLRKKETRECKEVYRARRQSPTPLRSDLNIFAAHSWRW